MWQTYIIENGVLRTLGVGENHNYGCNGIGPWLFEFASFDMANDFNGEKIKSIATSDGRGSYIVLTEDGNLYGWGPDNKLGIGNENSTLERKVIPITTISDVEEIIGGKGFFIVRKKDGSVWATGNNENGVLGRWIGIDRKTRGSKYQTAYEWVECPELEI